MSSHSNLLRFVGDESVRILTDLAIVCAGNAAGGGQETYPRFLFEDDDDLHHVEVRRLATRELLESQVVCRGSPRTACGPRRLCSRLPAVDPRHLRVQAPIPVNVYQKGGKLFLEGHCGAECAGAAKTSVIRVFDRDLLVQEIRFEGTENIYTDPPKRLPSPIPTGEEKTSDDLDVRCPPDVTPRRKNPPLLPPRNRTGFIPTEPTAEEKEQVEHLENINRLASAINNETKNLSTIHLCFVKEFLDAISVMGFPAAQFEFKTISTAFLGILCFAEKNLMMLGRQEQYGSIISEFSKKLLKVLARAEPHPKPLEQAIKIASSDLIKKFGLYNYAIENKCEFSEDDIETPIIQDIAVQIKRGTILEIINVGY